MRPSAIGHRPSAIGQRSAVSGQAVSESHPYVLRARGERFASGGLERFQAAADDGHERGVLLRKNRQRVQRPRADERLRVLNVALGSRSARRFAAPLHAKRGGADDPAADPPTCRFRASGPMKMRQWPHLLDGGALASRSSAHGDQPVRRRRATVPRTRAGSAVTSASACGDCADDRRSPRRNAEDPNQCRSSVFRPHHQLMPSVPRRRRIFGYCSPWNRDWPKSRSAGCPAREFGRNHGSGISLCIASRKFWAFGWRIPGRQAACR